ncbi:MAG: hypothetical protein RIR39_365, partial [Pseudomonadota bacterium]
IYATKNYSTKNSWRPSNGKWGAEKLIKMLVWKRRAKPGYTGDAKVKPQHDADYIPLLETCMMTPE